MKGSVPLLREEVFRAAELRHVWAAGFTPVPPVPIDEIIELHLKLEFEIRDFQTLFGFGDVHGAIYLVPRATDLRHRPGVVDLRPGVGVADAARTGAGDPPAGAADRLRRVEGEGGHRLPPGR